MNGGKLAKELEKRLSKRAEDEERREPTPLEKLQSAWNESNTMPPEPNFLVKSWYWLIHTVLKMDQ